jgi:Family of unknown function (DUF6206)
MSETGIDVELLERFEAGLDPRRPDRSAIPATVLGYGEISTVFEIDAPAAAGRAYKRMPMFRDEREAQAYEALYHAYTRALGERIGLSVVAGDTVRVADPAAGRVVLYIIQDRLPPDAIGHRAIQKLPPAEVARLAWAVLQQCRLVFDFNREHRGDLELGLDGQISNWAIAGFDPAAGALPPALALAYLDTSTPLMRRNGTEQLNPELLMRSAPSFTLWLLRRAFLPEVMTRYYDFRRVAMDLVANFYKEGRPELVPALVETVNRFFADELREPGFKPLTVPEIEGYYRFDALTWRVFLASRKLDRWLQGVRGREYPYTLPDKIAR